MSNTIAEYVKFNCQISLNYNGIMTLNGLSNGYYSPPSNDAGNPPEVMQTILGPTTNSLAIQACGASYIYYSPMGNVNYFFSDTITYNLPDGSLLTISFSIGTSQNVSQYSAVISSNSLFQIVDASLTGSGSSGYWYSFTVQMQQS